VLAQHPTVDQAIAGAASALVIISTLMLLVWITWMQKWRTLWTDWLTSTDHKRIGVMYIVLALVMLSRAVLEAVLLRFQQAVGLGGGFLSADHFAQLFTTHGTVMIFFMAMPFLTGLINIVVPLQIGARDMSFPLLNTISLGLTAAGAGLVMLSLVVGEFSTGGWSAYPPYTGLVFSPGVGPDYWIWSVTLGSVASTLTGINVAVTVYKQRAPGMTLMRMPMFTWTALCVAILMVFALPPLTAACLMLAADRYLDFHFFTNDLGGNMMNFANLFWLFGHPEVYILVLPAFGIFSEVFATFSAKRLFGYTSLVVATLSITVLSFSVWVHHFFTMGQSASINAVFGLATMAIAIPTGVKVFDWMATMFRGRVRFSVPMVYALSFSMLFVIGGLTGILLANPAIDYQVHNSLFLVAHFHNMLVPGLLFGMLAGYSYWFPKVFGFRLNDAWGYVSAACWVTGFVVTFFPLYAVGLLGMPRRSVSFVNPLYQPYMLASAVGAVLVLFALLSLLIQLGVSVRDRRTLAVPAGDPWDGRTLEWSLPSPPPVYNFAVIPHVTERDAFAAAKARGPARTEAAAPAAPAAYADIELAQHSVMGLCFAVLGAALGFALVWFIWWLAVLSLLVLVGAVTGLSFVTRSTRTLSAAEVARTEHAFTQLLQATHAIGRDDEQRAANRGLAAFEMTRAA
jgi:cytochrome o ubiquinol oxidase subunit 1